jgi:peptidoglycan-associated lipoprotein
MAVSAVLADGASRIYSNFWSPFAMMQTVFAQRGGKLILAACLALSVGACASKNSADDGSLAGGAGGASTPGSVQDFVVNVGDRVFFETDQTQLTAQGQATLDKQAEWLNRYPRYSFVIEGNADERGTREYNFALGARRAESVRNYLTARGVSSSRMRTISYGKERPVAVCNDISCWSQNRRAVTNIGGTPGS